MFYVQALFAFLALLPKCNLCLRHPVGENQSVVDSISFSFAPDKGNFLCWGGTSHIPSAPKRFIAQVWSTKLSYSFANLSRTYFKSSILEFIRERSTDYTTGF